MGRWALKLISESLKSSSVPWGFLHTYLQCASAFVIQINIKFGRMKKPSKWKN